MKHLTAAALLACAASVQAMPYAVTYNGTLGTSTFPEITGGQSYSITLVLDNGGATTASQTWSAQHLTCVIWRMNDAGNVALAQQGPIADVIGTITTSGSGALTGFFTHVQSDPATSFTTSGFTAPLTYVGWIIDGTDTPVFGSQLYYFGEASGGGAVSTNPSHWVIDPQPFTGPCVPLTAVSPTPVPTPVPTLGHAALALLSASVAGLGFWRRRRRVS